MPVEAVFAIQEILKTVIVGVTVVAVAFSPVGRAIGNRIMHGRMARSNTGDAERMDDVSREVAALGRQVDELQERVDFAERVLAQARERGQLGPAGAER